MSNTRKDLDQELVRRLYQEELLSIPEMARHFGCHQRVVRRAMKAAGIPSRKTGPRAPEYVNTWKGGWTTDKSGYILKYAPQHPDSNGHGYIRLHRLVMEQKLGRRLSKEEVVHHKDGDPSNNNPENLELFQSNGEHLRVTLAGKCPNWTEDGKRRIREAQSKPRPHRRKRPAQIATLRQSTVADALEHSE